MKHSMMWAGCVLLLPTIVACQRDPGFAPGPAELDDSATTAADQAAADLIALAGWEPSDGAAVDAVAEKARLVLEFEREVIVEDVAHYSAQIQVGPGEYDRIGLHRVVRERYPGRPIKTHQNVFLQHGDLKDFEGMFIPGQYSPNLPDDFGLAVYLAQRDVDVWGIDQNWNLVPAEETDFAFMEDWSLQGQVDNLGFALAVARAVRLKTSIGNGRMLLLGYSSGAMTGLALLNQESQLPPGHRLVTGFICADLAMKTSDPDFQAFMCARAASYQALYDAGQYHEPLPLQYFAHLARTAPDEQSPFAPPGITNLQFVIIVGGGPNFGATSIHYHAPTLAGGLPDGFQLVTVDQWLDFLANTANYLPTLYALEWSQLLCDAEDLPYDDHLGDIVVPVLDIGGAGGFAPYTAYTASLLGSADITQIYVSTGAPDPLLDYGHIDIFTGYNAPELVWQPIFEWIVGHTPGGPARVN